MGLLGLRRCELLLPVGLLAVRLPVLLLLLPIRLLRLLVAALGRRRHGQGKSPDFPYMFTSMLSGRRYKIDRPLDGTDPLAPPFHYSISERVVQGMVEFRIDRRSGVATYLQIVQQTQQALRLGLLEPGDKLPTAREVVEATAINPNTVLKAYRELEREGLVEARRGLGTFVRKSLGSTPADSPLRGELSRWASRARASGLERDDVAALFSAVLEEQFTKGDHA